MAVVSCSTKFAGSANHWLGWQPKHTMWNTRWQCLNSFVNAVTAVIAAIACMHAMHYCMHPAADRVHCTGSPTQWDKQWLLASGL